MNKSFQINIPISKIDEEQRIVTGIATSEALDSQGDIVDYEASKKAFTEWQGNIREMHGDKAIGKSIDVQFDDAEKQVILSAYISKSLDGENAWTKVKEGILTGFSIGGRIFEVAKDKAVEGANRVLDYALSETSLVDSPANPEAKLVMVKSVNGVLRHVEESIVLRPVHNTWWADQYMMPIEKAEKLYNKSMSKQTNQSKETSMNKSMWDASWLLDLAMQLASYINGEVYEGENVDELKSALDTIKTAVTQELNEAPETLEVAIELACKVTNLKKESGMTDMKKGGAFVEGEEPRDAAATVVTKVTASPNAKKAGATAPAPIKKSTAVVGGEERDAAADVVTTAEENGRPVNDTEVRAAAAQEPVASDEESEIVEKKPVEEAIAEDVKQEDAVVDEKPVVDAPTEDKASEKATTVADLAKSVDTLVAKLDKSNTAEFSKIADAVSAISDKVEKSMATLEGRIKAIEDSPAAIKPKASYVEVAKGDESTQDADVAELVKRSDYLAEHPGEASPHELAELTIKLRKAQKDGLLTSN